MTWSFDGQPGHSSCAICPLPQICARAPACGIVGIVVSYIAIWSAQASPSIQRS